jgi:predicted RNA-binding Zn ribbon-like protein
MKKWIRKGGIQTSRGFLFELSGGDIALDFVNTVDSRPTESAKELLPTSGELFSWSRQVGVLSRKQESYLVKNASRHPKEAERALKSAIALRECMFQVFSRITEDQEIPEDLLAKWNQYSHRSINQHELVQNKKGFAWQCKTDVLNFDSMLWPVVHSAVKLLTGPNVSRIRRCAAANCDWLFLDTSKRGNRRWCDMTVCGNRAKAQRFYSRKKLSEKYHQP